MKISSDSEDDAESLGMKVGLLKAIKDFNLRRVISFHSRVSRAREFSEKLPVVLNWMNVEKRPTGHINADFVSGEMPTNKRREKLKKLKEIGLGDRSLLTNARCLAEGVDVPSLDGICFVDPRSSPLDIIQAVGRAIRLSDEKKIGTIVLPIFIGNQDDISNKIESSRYKAVWDVLNALKSHDDRLSEELKAIRFKLGKRDGNSRVDLSVSNITIDLPQKVDQSFIDSFTTLVVQNTTESWDEVLGRLMKFKEREGHLRVPQYFESDGYRLGLKVVNLRQQKKILSPSRISILNEMGFIWNELDQKWNEFILALTAFKEREGHLNVQWKHVESGYFLGHRVLKYRAELEDKNEFYKDRLDQLDKLGFIWDLNTHNWNIHFQALEQFKQREGHITVPRSNRENGLLLSKWIQRQRTNFKDLTDEQAKKLLDIGFLINPFDFSWNEALAFLDSYILKHGNCDVPQRHLEGNFKLGVWCHNQRKQFSEEKLSADKIEKLKERGFNWNPLSSLWNEWIELLKEYKELHGNFDLPKRTLFKDKKLGYWISNIRSSKDKLTKDRIKQLDDLGFTWSKQ